MSSSPEQHSLNEVTVGNFALVNGIQRTCNYYNLQKQEVLSYMRKCLESYQNPKIQFLIQNSAIKYFLINKQNDKKSALHYDISEGIVKDIRIEFLQRMDFQLMKNPKEDPSLFYPYSENEVWVQSSGELQSGQSKWKDSGVQTGLKYAKEDQQTEEDTNLKQSLRNRNEAKQGTSSESDSQRENENNQSPIKNQQKKSKEPKISQKNSNSKTEANGTDKNKNLNIEEIFKILKYINLGQQKSIVSKESNVSISLINSLIEKSKQLFTKEHAKIINSQKYTQIKFYKYFDQYIFKSYNKKIQQLEKFNVDKMLSKKAHQIVGEIGGGTVNQD